LNLIFTPVVTLHNPYNVNISFHEMEVIFENIPVAFNFMFQAGGAGGFASQSVEPGKFESINTMSYDAGPDHNGRSDKKFVMNIANWSDAKPLDTSSSITGPIVMKPGQTLICGPSFPPKSSFKADKAGERIQLNFRPQALTDPIHRSRHARCVATDRYHHCGYQPEVGAAVKLNANNPPPQIIRQTWLLPYRPARQPTRPDP
jgi:hypothetical protein